MIEYGEIFPYSILIALFIYTVDSPVLQLISFFSFLKQLLKQWNHKLQDPDLHSSIHTHQLCKQLVNTLLGMLCTDASEIEMNTQIT